MDIDEAARIVHSNQDGRYEAEFLKYAPLLVAAINTECLAVMRRPIPRRLVPKDAACWRHGDLTRVVARFLVQQLSALWAQGYSLAGSVDQGAAYSEGRADLLIVDPEGEPHIAAEVGEVRADKPLKCFHRSSLQELWVCPYPDDATCPRLACYIFRRGPNFGQLEQHWEREEARVLEAMRRHSLVERIK